MFSILGKITARILNGDIPTDSVNVPKRSTPDDNPSTKALKAARGQGLGSGAERRRDGTHYRTPKKK